MSPWNTQEAKTHLSRLVERAQAGERIVIAKAGTPVVELVAVRRPDIIFGAYAGEVIIDDALFTSADADMAALFDEDLGVEP